METLIWVWLVGLSLAVLLLCVLVTKTMSIGSEICLWIAKEEERRG